MGKTELLTKYKVREESEVACQDKASKTSYKALCTTNTLARLIIIPSFHTKDLDGVGDTVNIFMFLEISLYAGSEATMLAMRWDTTIDIKNMTTYEDMVYLLHIQHI